MKGIRKFQLSSKNILFDIELHRNVTVIRGDGATYKTMFCNMLRAAHVKEAVFIFAVIKLKSSV